MIPLLAIAAMAGTAWFAVGALLHRHDKPRMQRDIIIAVLCLVLLVVVRVAATMPGVVN